MIKTKTLLFSILVASMIGCSGSDKIEQSRLLQLQETNKSFILEQAEQNQKNTLIMICKFVATEYFLGKTTPSHIGLRLQNLLSDSNIMAITLDKKDGQGDNTKNWVAI